MLEHTARAGGDGCTHAMHGHCRVAIVALLYTVPGRSTSDFHRRRREFFRNPPTPPPRCGSVFIRAGGLNTVAYAVKPSLGAEDHVSAM